MSSSIDIPACHSPRNPTTLSGNQVLCASPEGISEDPQLSRPFSVSAISIIVGDVPGLHDFYRHVARCPADSSADRVPCALECDLWLPRNPDLGRELPVRCLQSQVVIDRVSQFLFASEIMLGCLNRCAPKQELDLFKFAPSEVASSRGIAAEVMWSEVLDFGTFRSRLTMCQMALGVRPSPRNFPCLLTRRKIAP